MKRWLPLALSITFALGSLVAAQEAAAPQKTSVIVVIGAAGEEQFGEEFSAWAKQWEEACTKAGAQCTVIGREAAPPADHERLRTALAAQAVESPEALWVVMLGHGTWDGRDAKFNLRGDDVSAAQLNEWLTPFQRPVAVVAGFSSSGAFLKPLAAPGRVIVTATKSGSEELYARFGGQISKAIGDLQADFDKDGQVSLLEAWLGAARGVAEFYEKEGRLATEHSLLEDNGDGLGTPADWFTGIRATKRAKDGAVPDGLRAHQFHLIRNPEENALSPALRAERDTLELQIAKLREAKATFPEDQYYKELEALLLKLARIYQKDAD
ncbi:MAG: hypothetical protein ACO1QR_00065 [Chthoniobacteraceae bacterium]